MRKTMGTWGAVVLAVAILTGCSEANNVSLGNRTNSTMPTNSSVSTTAKSATSNQTMIVGGQQYEGKANLVRYEDKAKSNPKDAKAQVEAGIAAHVNGNDSAAINYYNQAIASDPKSALAYNNLGNIYLRDKNDAKAAINYYEKATQLDPSYGYGWWNLAIAEAQTKNNDAAKAALESGLKNVEKSDPTYKDLQAMQKELATAK
ncbi:tetratricopeptide repeat protein [Alicyclobacillus dauci]|uniref:Tetratricopeptide repeat protein n=1 Tax=Alicyclobacillus dauci TaxID=1475485 RepID=A0ABY6Z1Q7_9BACL|nr:tetratricopeptide repeat protein [Alicyclobacillus dauci]WAH36822.1 tetratricopeptide repeat protein [Alicyclobacillus dauci]